MTTAPRKPLFSSDYRFDILLCLGLALAIFIPYRQVAGHRFVDFDDGLYTFQNTYIIRGLCWDSVCWAFTNTYAANWHPITWISHLVDRELFGPYAGGYLLENVGWHALASCLCYLAFLKTTGSRLFAFCVALFFAVHPANVENVAWTSERKSLLDAVLWFCAILTYLDFIETRSFRSYGMTAVAHLLGLMCKAMSVTLPCTLVLVHILYLVYRGEYRDAPRQLRPWLQKFVRPVVPLLAISVYFSTVTFSAQATAMPGMTYSAGQRMANALLSYERYLAMFFHPTQLAIFYPLFENSVTFRSAVPATLLLSAISIALLLLARTKPTLLIGWCWYLGTMVPAIGLVQVGSQSHADRYLYIPMLGLAFVFPVLFELLRSIRTGLWRAIVGTTLALFAASLIAATNIQVSYWKDGVTLFSHSLSVTGDCVTSAIDLAVAYHRAERYEEVVAYVDSKIPVATNPANKGRLSAIKASALLNSKKYEPAIASALKALDWGDTEVFPYWILSRANFELGRTHEAARWFSKARTAQQPVNECNYVDVRSHTNMAALEMLLKEKSGAEPGRSSPPSAGVAPAVVTSKGQDSVKSDLEE